ncbi:hypothetical protein CXF68_20310 [Tenacibaculum sp. Bg11-29]|uniref:hypothetical protein n=1 Tax=Tenacibaculum sp. Bg11-29 TaxID=2058306 RepID=UPI000C32A526|nr:hypothetical protein [Tenacibaculum sp. Bg11-29]PKH52898.1 hypothetical protein CXF68_20310 [Tenacibaculum sp. Bg11-29]
MNNLAKTLNIKMNAYLNENLPDFYRTGDSFYELNKTKEFDDILKVNLINEFNIIKKKLLDDFSEEIYLKNHLELKEEVINNLRTLINKKINELIESVNRNWKIIIKL